MNEPTRIGDVLKISSYLEDNVNVNKSNTTNVNVDINTLNNVYVTRKEQLLEEFIEKFIEECGGEPRAVAETIAKKLNDTRNLNYHLKMAKTVDPQILFESLSEALQAQREARVRTTVIKYYVGILKNKLNDRARNLTIR